MLVSTRNFLLMEKFIKVFTPKKEEE